ncbi:MAG: hypothetical protein KME64_02000 [Scytonematopsis contorta HA4267-MV1]|nr:hypothetical protein [Scytonematopsis contorta HA4267-MV1]
MGSGEWGVGNGGDGEDEKVTNYQLPITNYPLPITNYHLPNDGFLTKNDSY